MPSTPVGDEAGARHWAFVTDHELSGGTPPRISEKLSEAWKIFRPDQRRSLPRALGMNTIESLA